MGEALVKDVQKMTARRVAQRVMPEEAQRAVFVAMRFCRFAWLWGLRSIWQCRGVAFRMALPELAAWWRYTFCTLGTMRGRNASSC